jgi:hypothetical protein
VQANAGAAKLRVGQPVIPEFRISMQVIYNRDKDVVRAVLIDDSVWEARRLAHSGSLRQNAARCWVRTNSRYGIRNGVRKCFAETGTPLFVVIGGLFDVSHRSWRNAVV